MKLICAEYNERGKMCPIVLGDNALLRNNNPFYVPAFAETVSCVPQIVLRACKLGKGFAPRFASRYYNEVGVGLRFYADTFESELREKDLPPMPAFAFDESVAISELQPWAGADLNYRLEVNGESLFSANLNALPVSADEFVSRASGYYMIKIGDFFFCGNPYRYAGIRMGDRVRMFLGESCLLDFVVC